MRRCLSPVCDLINKLDNVEQSSNSICAAANTAKTGSGVEGAMGLGFEPSSLVLLVDCISLEDPVVTKRTSHVMCHVLYVTSRLSAKFL